MIAVAGNVLLDQLSPQTRQWMAQIARRSSYRDGEVIHKRGDPDPAMGVVITGNVRLVRLRADGTQTYVSSLLAGQHFGDVLMHGRSRRTHDAVAVGPTEIDHYDTRAFSRLLDNGEVLRALYAVTALRLADAMHLNDDLRGLPREVHLAKILLHLARDSADGTTVTCRQEDLACFLGTTVMTLAKSLTLLKNQGLVETGYRRIRIGDRERLRGWMRTRYPD